MKLLAAILLVLSARPLQAKPDCSNPPNTTRIATLTSSVDAKTQVLNLSSTRCIEASTPTHQTAIFVDAELMLIIRVENGIIVVKRGQARTSQTRHLAGQIVFYGPLPHFYPLRPTQ